MEPLTPSQKRALKSRAQRMQATLKLGRQGASEAFCCQLKEALSQHQLVKVRFVEFKDERKSMARHLADSVGCHLVTVVGHVAVFFQPAPLSDAQASGEESSELMA